MVGVDKLPSHEECGGCRSVGSNIHPSSQSQKMSIGIVVDSAHKARKKCCLVAKSSEPVAYHQTPIHQTYAEGISEKKDRGASLEKENHNPGDERPPWISTKDKPSVSKTLVQENQTLTTCFDAKYTLNGFSRSHSVRPVSEIASNASKRINQSVNNDAVPQGAAEAVPDKIKSINKPTDTLKMKLLEVLGPDTLPDDDKDLCDNQEQTRKANELENYIDVTAGNHAETPFEKNANDSAFKYGLNSDPIESDSDGPNNIMKRPVTRSFKRKSALPKSSPKRADNGLCHSLQKMNKHATVQIRGKKWSKEPKSTSVLSGGKRVAVKGVRIEPHKINFVEENDADKKASTNTKRSAKSLDTTAGLGEKYESSHLGSPLTDTNQTVPKSRFQNKDFRQNSTVKATSPDARPRGEGHPHSLGNDKENIIPQFGTHQRGFGLPDTKKGGNSINKSVNTKENESLREWFGISKKIFKPQEILHPITKATTPVEIPSPQPTEIFDQVRGDHNAVEENIFMGVKISNFGNWQTLNPRRNSSRVLVESSEDTLEKEVKDCPAVNSPASLDKSASEGYSSDSSEDNSHTGVRSDGVSEKQDVSSPEVNSESSESCLHRGKRPRRHEGTKFEYEEDDVFCVPSGQVEDDDLSRAVTMLAVALKKLETKVNSAMRKKSSEIVHSTAEGLNMQLQNVKTLIQRDIEKVTRIGKSKRKHMETTFQEQQEQLKIFHDNYKKGLNQHIQDTISTIEEMETDLAELNGSLEKQKSQHKKVLLQVEEEMENRLNEAHKLISNLHKVSNEKLLQLKYVIADCLK